MASNTAVYGLYKDQNGVEEAVGALKDAGFRNTDISVLLPENVGSKDFGHEKNTKAPEGAVAGGSSGAAIGGALGWLAGVGMLAIPGMDPFIAGGPIMGLLAGIGVGGTVGSVIGGLLGWGCTNMRPEDSKAASARAEFFCRFIVTPRIGSSERRSY